MRSTSSAGHVCLRYGIDVNEEGEILLKVASKKNDWLLSPVRCPELDLPSPSASEMADRNALLEVARQAEICASIHVEGWSLPLVKHGVLGPRVRIASLTRKETNYGGINQSRWIVQFCPVKGISSENPVQSIAETNEAASAF